jgi:hypothetical protein
MTHFTYYTIIGKDLDLLKGHVENIKYHTHRYLYGLITDIDNSKFDHWIEVLTLCKNGRIVNCDFKEDELELLTDKIKINQFNKLRVFK